MVMSGDIDLGAERVELAMRPTVKKGTGLDPTAFAGAVKIAGRWRRRRCKSTWPAPRARRSTLARRWPPAGATWLGERVLGKVIDAHPCESAYNGGAKTSTAKGAAPAPSAKADTGPLRRLFDR